jgi:hypothetical protein
MPMKAPSPTCPTRSLGAWVPWHWARMQERGQKRGQEWLLAEITPAKNTMIRKNDDPKEQRTMIRM